MVKGHVGLKVVLLTCDVTPTDKMGLGALSFVSLLHTLTKNTPPFIVLTLHLQLLTQMKSACAHIILIEAEDDPPPPLQSRTAELLGYFPEHFLLFGNLSPCLPSC